ncbi:hypothetical protein B0T22DRAFT_236537 [Podospora appendiculata]|uniref:Uncharacterized protein n=1 Tax=Podospora appendiculata TaxID=314037 RepID=A0AAE0X6C0_9PEZI|nr:hypothetical protein B0T22DRAFT_236537 [Podospora appendiculata]
MGFGDSITALLETYSNCLSLLKAYKRQDGGSILGADDQRVRLRKSLKSDRASVERAYTARLSEKGSRLEKGDARAVSALDRILHKLKAAITSLLRLSSQKQRSGLDYDSLKSLSNVSRIEAIQAIDHLSRRLGSASRASVVSSSSKPSTVPSDSSRHGRHGSSGSSASSKQHKVVASPSRKTPVKKEKPKEKPDRSGNVGEPSSSPRSSARSHSGPRASPQQTPVPNRISLISISTDSTKLGEIPMRRWQSRYTSTDSSTDGYNVPPLYPLKPYTAEVKEKRFWGLFGRKGRG